LLLGHNNKNLSQALDNAASSNGATGGANGNGNGGAGGGGGGGNNVGSSSGAATALSGPPGALNANLTDLGSPGVYNSTNGLMLITCRAL